MAFRDSWHRALVYFGLAEERDPYVDDEEDYEPEAQIEERYRERPNVRRLGARRRRDEIRVVTALELFQHVGQCLVRQAPSLEGGQEEAADPGGFVGAAARVERVLLGEQRDQRLGGRSGADERGNPARAQLSSVRH